MRATGDERLRAVAELRLATDQRDSIIAVIAELRDALTEAERRVDRAAMTVHLLDLPPIGEPHAPHVP